MGPKGIKVIARVKMELTATFKLMDMGPISFYLDFKVDRNYEIRTIKLFYLIYIQKILIKYHFDKVNTINIVIKEIALEPNLSFEVT